MRHFSLFDGMDDGFKKKTADDNYFTIDLGNESALLGLIDVLGWVNKNVNPMDSEGSSIRNIEELLDYANDLYSSSDFVLRINTDQFRQIRSAFEIFMLDAEEYESKDDFEEAYPDIEIEDIWEAEDKIMEAEMEPSSGKGLEDIPTMEKNPEDLAPGEIPTASNEICPKCHAVNTFSTVDEFGEIRCDSCGYADPARNPEPQAQPEDSGLIDCPQCGLKNAVDPTYQECENCGWDQTNACPDCFNDRSITIDEFGSKRCNNCGWAEEPEHPTPTPNAPGVLPPLTDAGKKIKTLEDAYNAPSVEHPLGPHTGSEEDEENFKQEFYKSGRFVNLAKWPSNPVWGVEVSPAAGQRDPMPGDLATIQQKSKSFNRPVPVTLVEDMGGAWTFENGHHPA